MTIIILQNKTLAGLNYVAGCIETLSPMFAKTDPSQVNSALDSYQYAKMFCQIQILFSQRLYNPAWAH